MKDRPEVTEIAERELEKLIRRFGFERVQNMLNTLLPSANFSDWQRVKNLAENVNRRLERQGKEKEK